MEEADGDEGEPTVDDLDRVGRLQVDLKALLLWPRGFGGEGEGVDIGL